MPDNKHKIAIVEDNEDIKEMYEIKLRLKGYDVVSEEDGARVMELIRTEHPDLILLDILLPNKDGFEILKEMRSSKDKNISSIPVMVISNLSNEEDVREAKRLGAVNFLVKAKNDPGDIVEEVNNFFSDSEVASFG